MKKFAQKFVTYILARSDTEYEDGKHYMVSRCLFNLLFFLPPADKLSFLHYMMSIVYHLLRLGIDSMGKD